LRYVTGMRITSGILRNRRINVPREEVRPTMEAVREAVFSSLGGSCAGLNVLDVFAGSGAMGLEAWSRGAAAVTFVEQHQAVWKILKQNIDLLDGEGLGKVSCVKADALRWLERGGERYDLILADPPYDLPDAMIRTLEAIARHSVLTEGGTLVYELRSSGAVQLPDGWKVVRDKTYGKTRVMTLQLKPEDEQ